MKKLKLIAAACLLSATIANAQKPYTLSGGIDHAQLKEFMEGKTVTITNPHSRAVIDSARVADGKFAFRGATAGDSVVYLGVGSNQFYFILEPGAIVFKDMKFSGTPQNDRLNEYDSRIDAIRQKINGEYRSVAEDKTLGDNDKSTQLKALFEKMNREIDAVSEEFLVGNKYDALNALVINKWHGRGDNVERYDKAMTYAGVYARNFRPLTAEKARMDALRTTQEGMPFVDFTVPTGNLDGTPVKFSDYIGKGKYVLVDFWASWCGPCRGEIPNLKETYELYKGDRFDIVSIAVWDQHDRTIKALEEENMPWPQIIDADKIPTELYGILGIPQIILFGPDGTIVVKGLRGENVKQKIAEVLSK